MTHWPSPDGPDHVTCRYSHPDHLSTNFSNCPILGLKLTRNPISAIYRHTTKARDGRTEGWLKWVFEGAESHKKLAPDTPPPHNLIPTSSESLSRSLPYLITPSSPPHPNPYTSLRPPNSPRTGEIFSLMHLVKIQLTFARHKSRQHTHTHKK